MFESISRVASVSAYPHEFAGAKSCCGGPGVRSDKLAQATEFFVVGEAAKVQGGICERMGGQNEGEVLVMDGGCVKEGSKEDYHTGSAVYSRQVWRVENDCVFTFSSGVTVHKSSSKHGRVPIQGGCSGRRDQYVKKIHTDIRKTAGAWYI